MDSIVKILEYCLDDNNQRRQQAETQLKKAKKQNYVCKTYFFLFIY